MSQMNPRQRDAVHYIDQPLLVLAGAGSGKTRVITQKIAYLIQRCGTPAHKIIAVTFTNKAAREMKARVGQLVSRKESRGLTVSTFHRLGLTMLQREHKTLGLKSGFSIFDGQDCKALLADLMQRNHENQLEFVDLFLNHISSWKNALVVPDKAISLAETDQELIAAHAYAEYDRVLRAYNAVDFDDLIVRPTELLRDNPEVRERWQNKVHYLLVDEYQDTNTSQYEMVKLLVGARQAFTVVGDDDQSIYAWRGAQPENLAKLQSDFPALNVIKLEQNYRSSRRILKAANTVIANNPHVFDKKLWSDLSVGDEIAVIRCKNDEKEAERVAYEIMNRKLQGNLSFKDFAVLYRGNHQARIIEIKLQALQIPYKVSGGTSFFARTEIKDIMAYLRLIINPDDDNAFLRIVNTPRREIGPTTLEKLSLYATERQVGLLSACSELGLEQHLSARGLQHLRRFSTWMEDTRERAQRDEPMAALNAMLKDIDYHDWLLQQSSSPQVAEKRMENVMQLYTNIRGMLKDQEDDQNSNDHDLLERVIGKLVLRDILDQQAEEDDSDRVQLMTLHAAKGLEFPHVYLVGMEEELLPHRNSIEEETIEEERRLFYVGITRAQQTLSLTLTAQRKQFGETIESTPSRFLDELPQDDLRWEGLGIEKPKEETQAVGKAHIANLRDMLNTADG